jgi:hypothetical protein
MPHAVDQPGSHMPPRETVRRRVADRHAETL